MDKKPLIGVSICAVVLLILGSLTNVVGFNTLKSTSLNDSPLFGVRTARATNTQQDVISSNYLGKGKQNTILFPLRNNRTALFLQFIELIKSIDDKTFLRITDFIVQKLLQRDEMKGFSKEQIKGHQ